MNPQYKPPENQQTSTPLMPRWAKVVLVAFALLVMLGYASPDMQPHTLPACLGLHRQHAFECPGF